MGGARTSLEVQIGPGQIKLFTPLCCEQVPLRFCEQLYELSLHSVVAVPQDAEIGDATVPWFDLGGGDGTGVGVGVGAGVGIESASESVGAGDGLGLGAVGRAIMVMWSAPAP